LSERDIDKEKVREEHLAEVNPAVHWTYLLGVVGAGLAAMLALIAWLGG
jgi:hypothetical protein